MDDRCILLLICAGCPWPAGSTRDGTLVPVMHGDYGPAIRFVIKHATPNRIGKPVRLAMRETVLDDRGSEDRLSFRRINGCFANDRSPATYIGRDAPGNFAWERDSHFKHRFGLDFLLGSEKDTGAADVYSRTFTPGHLAALTIAHGCLDREPLRPGRAIGAFLGDFLRRVSISLRRCRHSYVSSTGFFKNGATLAALKE